MSLVPRDTKRPFLRASHNNKPRELSLCLKRCQQKLNRSYLKHVVKQPSGTPLFARKRLLRENEEKRRIIMQHDVLYSYDDIKGRSSLAWAALQGNIGAARVLISAGVEIDAKDYDSSTPLHLACRQGHEHLVQFLIDSGCSLNFVDNKGWSALMHASHKGHLDCVKRLLAYADHTNIYIAAEDKQSRKYITAMDLAERGKHEEILQLLLYFVFEGGRQ
jgi:ankyrin repeat protein